MLEGACFAATFVLGVIVTSLGACGGNVVVDGSTGGGSAIGTGGETSSGPMSTTSTGTSGRGACTLPSENVCISFPANVGITECVNGSVVSSCPRANAVGKCLETVSGTSFTETFYAGGTITAAESGCASAGSVGARP